MKSKENYELTTEEIKDVLDGVINSQSSLDDVCDIPKAFGSKIYSSLFNDVTLIQGGVNSTYKLNSTSINGEPKLVVVFGGRNNRYDFEGDNVHFISHGGEGDVVNGATVRSYDFFKGESSSQRQVRPYLNGSDISSRIVSPRPRPKKELVLDY